MAKIIGLVTAWYAEKWIAAAIEQALQYCDEIIVAIGANTKPLATLEDATYSIASKYKNNVTLIKASISQTFDLARADTFNRMLSISKLRAIGNWVWILDADEFYFNDAHRKIRTIIDSNLYNHIRVEEKFFFINTTRYLLSSHGRLFRIMKSDNHFRPTQRWTGPMTKTYILKRDEKQRGMFHYSFLSDMIYRRLLWETHYNHQLLDRLKWLSDIYIPYDLDNEEFWIAENQRLFGVKSPFFTAQLEPNQDGKFLVYNDLHPPLIEKTKITKIQDFRKI